MQETLRCWPFIGLLLVLVASLAWAGDAAPASTPPPIAVIPQDGFNFVVDEQIDSHYVVVKLASPAHNWFAGTFTNLPTDKEVTIGLSMAGNDTKGNEGNVKKWEGLRPVMTYADPNKYETYEWFQKDAQGRWVSGDPFKQGEEKYAGTGDTPLQKAIPEKVAKEFLSKDGMYWQAWREIDTTNIVQNLNVFRIMLKFEYPTATVAMRVPYTLRYYQAFIEKLKGKNIPGLYIDDLGITTGGRKLSVIRFDSLKKNTEGNRTVLAVAAEHATEHASSWALHGMLLYLLEDTKEVRRMRENTAWILCPIQDPDGNVTASFDHLTDIFCNANDQNKPKEVFHYANYIINYINANNTIDVALSLHNVEANECKQVYCPFVDMLYVDDTLKFNEELFGKLKKMNYLTEEYYNYSGKGRMNFRLYGWCALHFGSFDLAYEINDRYPQCRLDIDRTCNIGKYFVAVLSAWLDSDIGLKFHTKALATLRDRVEKRSDHFKRRGYGQDGRTNVDILMRAY